MKVWQENHDAFFLITKSVSLIRQHLRILVKVARKLTYIAHQMQLHKT